MELNLWFQMVERYGEVFFEEKLRLAADHGVLEVDTSTQGYGDDLPCGRMAMAYRGVHNGYAIDTTHSDEVARYGEVIFKGVQEMLCEWITPPLGSEDVFVDYGCGVGKVCLQVALYSECGRVIGVELEGQRVQAAQVALSRLEAAQGRTLFLEGDMLDPSLHELLISETTCGFLCGVSFPVEVVVGLLSRLAKNAERLRFLLLVIPAEVDAVVLFEALGRKAVKRSAVVPLDTTWWSQAPALIIEF